MENVLMVCQILSTNSLQKRMEVSLENCIWIVGFKGLKNCLTYQLK